MAVKKRKGGENPRDCVRREAFSHLKPVAFEGNEYPDYVGMADGYAQAVLDGRVPENQFVALACKRYAAMRKASETAVSQFYWSPQHVVEACAFVEACPRVEGGIDDELLVLQPVQCWIVANIFGFRRTIRNQSVRWFTEVLLDAPRKFGKSGLLSAIDLYIFLYEHEKGSQVLLGASSRGQALKVYGPIRKILNAEPDLVERHGLKVTSKETRKPDGGFIGMVSSIGRKEDGAIPHVIHIDELHAVTEALYDVFSSAMGARDNELLLQTTTAGLFANGPAYAQRKRLERVLKGQEIAPNFFGAIWTVDEEDLKDPLRWENVVKAHPMLGITIKAETIRSDMEAARFNASRRGEFIAKRLNVYARGANHAISPDEWRQNLAPKLSLDSFRGKKCWIGVDLSSHDDQTAIALLFEHEEPGAKDLLAVFVFHFIPEESPAFQSEKVADQIEEWVREGQLTATPGPLVDYEIVQAKIEEFCGIFDVEAVVFDRAHSVQMAGNLIKKGIKAGIIAANSVEMSEPTKDFVVRARHKRLRHNGNPVLAWNAQNVCLTPGDLWRPIKDRTAPHLKIDGISACIHANVARYGRAVAKMPKEDEKPKNPRIRTFS